MTKVELYELIKPRRNKEFLDHVAEEHGHRLLRLPSYHCDLNPIELVWAQMNACIRRQNTSGSIQEVEGLLQNAIQTISTYDWAKCCQHVHKLEKCWVKDGLLEDIGAFIVPLDGCGSESDSDWDSD